MRKAAPAGAFRGQPPQSGGSWSEMAGTAQPWLGDSPTKAKTDKGKGRALALRTDPFVGADIVRPLAHGARPYSTPKPLV